MTKRLAPEDKKPIHFYLQLLNQTPDCNFENSGVAESLQMVNSPIEHLEFQLIKFYDAEKTIHAYWLKGFNLSQMRIVKQFVRTNGGRACLWVQQGDGPYMRHNAYLRMKQADAVNQLQRKM